MAPWRVAARVPGAGLKFVPAVGAIDPFNSLGSANENPSSSSVLHVSKVMCLKLFDPVLNICLSKKP